MSEPKLTPGPIITAYGCIKDLKVIDRNKTKASYFLSSAAPDLYAATDWVDEIKGFGKGMSEWIPVESVKDDEEFEITLSGAEIRALINARRKARGE